MSQNENPRLKLVSLLLTSAAFAVTLAFNACGQGFSSAQFDSGVDRCSDTASCALTTPGLTPNPLPNPSPGTTPTAGNFSSLAATLTQALQTVASSFPGLSAAANCQTAGPCTGAGPSSQTYTAACAFSGINVSGSTTLSYNGASCTPLGSSAINISPSLTYSSSTENFAVTSSAPANYTGPAHSGGFSIGYSILNESGLLSLPGLYITSAAESIGAYSTSAANVALNLSAPSVTVNGGNVVLVDNTNNYSANLTFNNIVFGTTCACPVGGSLSGTLTGSKTGTVTMTFSNSCGTLIVSENGAASTQTVAGCTH